MMMSVYIQNVGNHGGDRDQTHQYLLVTLV